MTTTTIRLDDALKARLAAAAERAGKTPHAFIRDAIVDTVEKAEQDTAFDRLADARWANLLATGKTVNWDDAQTWLTTRARGQPAPKPIARKPG